MSDLKWIQSDGGPLILVDNEGLKVWSGIMDRTSFLSGNSEVASDFMDPAQADYGEACAVYDYLGLLNRGGHKVLVFGDEPLATTIVRSSPTDMIIAQVVYGETDVEKWLITELPATGWEESIRIEFKAPNQYLFDASANGRDLLTETDEDEFLIISLSPGEYQAYISFYEPDDETKLILYKLVKVS